MSFRSGFLRALLSIATGLIPSVFVAGSASAETWSDATGKFKLEAEYEGIDGKNVVLRKSDGKTVNIPIGNLSRESRAQAKAHYEKSKANPASSGKYAGSKPAMATTAQGAYKPRERELKFTPPAVPILSPMPAFPEKATLEETLDHVRNQALAGHLDVFWFALPDDLRATMDSNETRDALRPAISGNMNMSNEAVSVIDKLTEIFVTKKTFILKSPILSQAPPQFMPLIQQGYDPAVGLIFEYSEIARNADAIVNTSLSNFLGYHLPRIGGHFQALVKIVPAALRDPYINGIVAKQTDDSTGTISWPNQDGTTGSTEMVRYSNRWLPKEFAEQWQAEKDTLIEKLVASASSAQAMTQNNPQSKEMFDSMVKQANAMLDPLIAAKSQQEFDFAMGQMMVPMMMIFSGAGGPGAGGPGAPDELGEPAETVEPAAPF